MNRSRVERDNVSVELSELSEHEAVIDDLVRAIRDALLGLGYPPGLVDEYVPRSE